MSDYNTGKKVYEAYAAVETAEDSISYPTKRAQAKKAVEAVTEARSNAINLKSESAKRIKSITDAVGNTAVFSYDADGRISAITDPSAPNGGNYNKNASAKHTYRYTGGNLTGITYSNGKTASYSYDGNRNLTQMRDHAGYSVNLSYNAKNRVTQVSETGSSNTAGQKYTIAYNSDNTNEFRFSGANDTYGDSDDVINTYVFDEKGKTLCEYSVLAGDSKKVIGATAVTYDGDEQDGTDTGNNKIKDSAVVGSHSINYLTNHSFELNDLAWLTYTAGGTLPAGAIAAKSTKKHYIGQNCAYFDQTKAVKGTAGLKQSLTLKAGTYTFSGYAALDGADSSKAYLEVSANGTIYKSTVLTGTTAQEFDNGWQRLTVTFTVNSTQKIEVRAAVECTAAKGVGNIAFDCMQLEDDSAANSYNILEDGSFERKSGSDIFQLGWSYEGTGSTAQDNFALGDSNVTDGEGSYHIVSEPGKNKSFTFKTYLGSDKASFTLTGWVKADTTPIRKDRELYVKARHKVSDTESIVAKQKINAYSKGWQYFCLMMPAHSWGSTTISIQFDDNIGDLYIDGFELTKNDVQTRVYNTDGKMTSKHVAQKDTSYGYDDAGRVARSAVRKESNSAYNGSRVQYAYSKGGKIANLSYDTGDGKIKSYVYTYAKDGLPEKSVFPDASYQTLSYDSLRRNNEKVYYPVKNATAAKRLYTSAAFTDGQSSASTHKGTTTLIKTYTNKIGTADKASEYTYAYDEWGNITGITESVRGNKGTYTYNEYGELTKAVEVYTKNKTTQITCTYDYTYDSGENIKTEKVTGASGTVTHTYTYDSVWKDKLISYDGNSITYDAMGNPTNYMGAAMTWDVKGNLTSVSGRNGKSAAYTYLSDGQRYTKTTGGKTTTYLYNNGLLLSETTGNEVINYYYDSDGTVLGIGCKKGSYDEKYYFFEKNAFGDVIAVYRNSDSVLIGTYEYDLWGNPVSVNEAASGRDTDGILQKNPFRYRCYYYDTETGFYYLNSRYYDPQIRRFISADSIVTNTGTDVLGHNLYSYCNNSPLNKTDSDGHFPKLSEIFTVIAVIAFIVAAGILIVGSGGLGGGALALAGGGMLGSGAATAAATNAAMVGVGATCAASASSMMESSGNSGYNKSGSDNSKSYKKYEPKEIERKYGLKKGEFHREVKPNILSEVTQKNSPYKSLMKKMGNNPDIHLSSDGQIKIVST